MLPWNALWQWTVGRPDSAGKRSRRPWSPVGRLAPEALEDRVCLSGGYLLVDSFNTNSVLRYNETTGAFVDEFVPKNSGGLYSGGNMDLGPDHDLYVSNGLFSNNNKANDVLRYDGTTGTFLGAFADGGQLTDPRGVIFGSDGNLYVADGNGPGRVLRFDGRTGAFLDTFVPLGSGGLSHPSGMLFGPDGDLYVVATDQSEVLRFQGPTGKHPGAFVDTFVAPGSGGLNIPLALAFGPDGNLYVANSRGNSSTSGGILRFQGPTGEHPGALIDTFVAPGSGGLIKPLSVAFGPGGTLFVGSADTFAASVAKPHTSTVLRYDGTTGAFLDTFVTADSGGLRYPAQLLFTETDPVTLAYTGNHLMAASIASQPPGQTRRTNQVMPLPDQPLHDPAAWGGLVDPAPGDNSEFDRPDHQGERNWIDRLTTLEHTGTRRTPQSRFDLHDPTVLSAAPTSPFAERYGMDMIDALTGSDESQSFKGLG